MRTLRILAPVLLPFTAACALAHATSELWSEDVNVLACVPASISEGQALRLILGPAHGSELGIRRESDGLWYFLVVQSPPEDMTALMTPLAFTSATELTLAADVKGAEWTAGGGMRRIFSAPGKYTIHSSDALESEKGGYSCSIRYEG